MPSPAPLDLALFNSSRDPFGAHLGVWLAPGEVVHLCKEVGHPVVWPLEEFSRRARYATIVGFKRVRVATSLPSPGPNAAAALDSQ